MSAKPRHASVPEPTSDSIARDDFIRGGRGKETLPWEATRVRDDILRPISTKIPEPLWLMVEFLSDNTDPKESRQEIIANALRRYLTVELRERLGIDV